MEPTFFLRGFHSLLRACTEFYQQANFTTVIPDGFPILNHLREVHLTLAEGAHNQYGDLPWTARAEMLSQQWILARPEVREFLGGRIMVPYTEPWMDRVDNMKSLQGWNPTNITHFRDLGAFGEQLLLSIRYGSWNDPTIGATNAANWAFYWREEVQRYIHAKLLEAQQFGDHPTAPWMINDASVEQLLALKAGGKFKDAATINWEEVAQFLNTHERNVARIDGDGVDDLGHAAFFNHALNEGVVGA